jgi:protein TonB
MENISASLGLNGATSAGPFGAFGPALRGKADQIAVVSKFRFTREQTLETANLQ